MIISKARIFPTSGLFHVPIVATWFHDFLERELESRHPFPLCS